MSPIVRYSTRKQNMIVLQYTLLKLWEPEQQPQPTIEQASAIIDELFAWSKEDRAAYLARNAGDTAAEATARTRANEIAAHIIKMLQVWFPSWDGASLQRRFFGKKKSNGNGHAYSGNNNQHEQDEEQGEQQLALPIPELTGPAQQQEQQQEPTEPVPQPQPKPKKQPKPKQQQPAGEDPTIAWLMAKIEAGQRIFWLTGPSGSGKTTLAQIAAQRLELPCTLVSCCAGTSPGEFRGFQFPEPRPSAFTSAFGLPGVIIADEITTLDPSVAAVLNAALANTEINTVCGVVKRDPECIIIATSNTMGTGADRQYIGNNQLDAATLDRFKGGRRFVDYNEAYERSSFDAEIVSYVHRARRVVSEHKLRRIVSTRAIIAAQIDKEAGMEWRDTVTDDWTPEEKAILGRAA